MKGWGSSTVIELACADDSRICTPDPHIKSTVSIIQNQNQWALPPPGGFELCLSSPGLGGFTSWIQCLFPRMKSFYVKYVPFRSILTWGMQLSIQPHIYQVIIEHQAPVRVEALWWSLCKEGGKKQKRRGNRVCFLPSLSLGSNRESGERVGTKRRKLWGSLEENGVKDWFSLGIY